MIRHAGTQNPGHDPRGFAKRPPMWLQTEDAAMVADRAAGSEPATAGPGSNRPERAGPKPRAGKPSGKRPWFPVYIVEDLDGILATIGPNAFCTLLALRGFAGGKPYAFPSLETLMNRTRLKRTSQKTAINTLKEHQLIWVFPRRTKHGKQTASHYWLRQPTDEEIEKMIYPRLGQNGPKRGQNDG